MNRFLMKCNLATWKSDLTMGMRKISLSDSKVLGEVMYEAYKGTIDYSDETVEEARTEVEETLKGKYGKTIEDACLLIEENGQVVSAVIFNWFEKKQLPLLTFSMTRASAKGKGHAKNLLKSGLSVLNQAGYSECCLFVTEGNEPAISIYKKLGFQMT